MTLTVHGINILKYIEIVNGSTAMGHNFAHPKSLLSVSSARGKRRTNITKQKNNVVERNYAYLSGQL